MIIWVLDSESGLKLFYKSFIKVNSDEDIASGFLAAFRHFAVIEFQQELESIEMAGLKWIYILEQQYNLLFIAADSKEENSEIMKARLNVIKNEFLKRYKDLYKKRGGNWDGDINVFNSFSRVVEDYYIQWEKVEDLSPIADFFDILGVFQRILIMINHIIEKRMYSKSRNQILEKIDQYFQFIAEMKKYRDQLGLDNIKFSKESWFEILDINLMKSDKNIVIEYLKQILSQVVQALIEVKGTNLCLKYFHEEKVLFYIYNNLDLLKDLQLVKFFLRVFLIL
ncbi:MAG: hypothetical protein GF317_21770 [Candidatus Lokiarchaeota archaeon]|nr:hypothetical protein [Candidatus Lokiarchaeota archaeon]MBD3202090.1 hypothetical protein [Candidatus Lokiarchaeota archaeon]